MSDIRLSILDLGWAGVTVNVIAGCILAYALIVPYLDTKRTKATFALGADFFQKFVFGNILFTINALFSIADTALNTATQKDPKLYFMFFVFVAVNCLGFYLNSSILRMKKANMKAAEEKGISEQEYWERYLKNS